MSPALDAISGLIYKLSPKDLHKEFEYDDIFVTHDTDEALRVKSRIAVLQDGDSSGRRTWNNFTKRLRQTL